MSPPRRRIPAWAWIAALVPLSVFALGVASALAVFGMRKYLAARPRVEASATPSVEPAPPPSSALPLAGEAADLSSVMGRARKLADGWQREASLLGIEAVLHQGRIQTQAGASARLTFGPSAFATTRPSPELFVVTYDQTGIRGVPAAGRPGKGLPEPMCAPEHVLLQLPEFASKPVRLRYGLDADERVLWFATPHDDPERLRVFDPTDCSRRGNVVVVPRPRR